MSRDLKEGLETIYESKTNFLIVGLSGKTGVGCSTVADMLSTIYNEKQFTLQEDLDVSEQLRQKIVHGFSMTNFSKEENKFFKIKSSHIMLFLWANTASYSKEEYTDAYIKKMLLDKLNVNNSNQEFINKIKNYCNKKHNEETKIYDDNNIKLLLQELTSFFLNEHGDTLDFKKKFLHSDSVCFSLNDVYSVICEIVDEYRNNFQFCIKDLQRIGNKLREKIDLYCIPRFINYVIKSYKQNKREYCYVVIDSLKNPFEIMYFKDRYSAYYNIYIHTEDDIIRCRAKNNEYENIKIAHKNEMDNKDSLSSAQSFNAQNISECIQRSDIFINNSGSISELFYQTFKFVSLMIRPGLITPSKDESIMQIAISAKLNSGCISRQVGAVVLNKQGSVKSVGWNDTPEGQVSCKLRSYSGLMDDYSCKINKIHKKIIYSEYELDEVREFISKISPFNFSMSNKKGLNDSFCFKDIKNMIDGNKNQVYTRSLHAEENAFLQLAKYGNEKIVDGELFTTAFPCFLCAKKAYNLGIKRIVYIESYPDISNKQIFKSGSNNIHIVHYTGAVGSAYHKLYEPIFSYKDELKVLNS